MIKLINLTDGVLGLPFRYFISPKSSLIIPDQVFMQMKGNILFFESRKWLTFEILKVERDLQIPADSAPDYIPMTDPDKPVREVLQEQILETKKALEPQIATEKKLSPLMKNKKKDKKSDAAGAI